MKKTLIVTGSPRRGTTDALAEEVKRLIGENCTLMRIRNYKVGP